MTSACRGFLSEGASAGRAERGERRFELFKRLLFYARDIAPADATAGGYFALSCGHDHKNSFVGHAHDIELGYAPTCGFECYGPKSRFRGIRLFEFREDNPMAYVTRMLTWGDLVGRYSSNELRVFFEDHCVTDLIGVRNELRRPQVSATLLGAGAVTCGASGYAVRGLLRKSQ